MELFHNDKFSVMVGAEQHDFLVNEGDPFEKSLGWIALIGMPPSSMLPTMADRVVTTIG